MQKRESVPDQRVTRAREPLLVYRRNALTEINSNEANSEERVGLLLAVFLILMATTLPVQALGQGRGHGQSKKSKKFINGHDARDGRWDGGGPRLISIRTYRGYRHRHRAWSRGQNISKAVVSTTGADVSKQSAGEQDSGA